MGGTEWMPGVVALVLGGLAGVAIWGRLSRAAPVDRPAGEPDPRARRDDALRRLRELPADAPAQERHALELAAATAQRDLDRSRADPPKPEQPPLDSRPSTRSFLLGAWAGASAILLLVFVKDMLRPPPDFAAAPVAVAGTMGMASSAAPDPGPSGEFQGEPDVAGTIDFGGPAGSIPESAVIFVVARPDGQRRGPPIAAAKVPANGFPVGFRLGLGDSMMGAPLPDRSTIEARVDFDGDPMTRDPSEPIAVIDGVARGSRDLKLLMEARPLPQR